MEKNFTTWDDSKEISGIEKYLLQRANIPKYQWIEDKLIPTDGDEDAFSRLLDIRNNLREFVCSEKNNLIICSSSIGNGKTSWAVKLMLTYIEKNAHRLIYTDEKEVDKLFDIALFCSVIPFLVEMKQFGNNSNTYEMYSRLKKSELVILDDIGVSTMSQYDYNILYAIVESRLFAGLPTIFTTNATSEDELRNSLGGPRLANRIWATSEIINIKGLGLRGVM